MDGSNSLDDSPSRQAQAQTRTHSGGGGGGDAPSNPSQPQPQLQSQSQREGEEVDETKKEEEELIEKAQKRIDKITSSPDNPNPTLLHALSSLLETQESLARQLPEATLENNIRAADERSLADLDERSLESVGEDNDDIDIDGGERRHGRDLRDVKIKFAELDESGRDDLLRHMPSRGWTRHRGRGRVNETALENEQVSISPDSGSRSGSGPGRSARDRNSKNLLDVKKGPDTRKFQGNILSDGLAVERDDNDDCFQGCRIGTKDISDLVKKAVQAAESEARGANTPAGAIKAAGDAAAEYGSRLLIAPAPSPTAGDTAAGINGCLLLLRHPKSGNATNYLLSHDNEGAVLQELHWFKQSYASWFLGDYVSQDGSLYTATPVDPVFILLPIFEEARMKKRDDLGKFRQLDEIIFINDYPGYHHLMSIAENCMGVVCEIKEIGSSKFFRLDDSKVLAWLYCKVFQLKNALCSLDKNYAAQDEKYTLAGAVSILGEYVKDEPWLMLLLDHLKLNLLEVTSKVLEAENFPTNAEHNPVSSSLLQEKDRSEDKTKRSGKQAKKAKVETESRNIREMFRRACRKS
ncbi:hypothetical protein Peur_046459 [Populus x canadensis]